MRDGDIQVLLLKYVLGGAFDFVEAALKSLNLAKSQLSYLISPLFVANLVSGKGMNIKTEKCV